MSRYCVGIHRRIDVYSIDGAGIEYTIDLKCRPNGLAFLDNNTVAVGGENTKVQVNIYLLSSNLVLSVCPIITQKLPDRFASNFYRGTRGEHGNVLSLRLRF